MIKLKNLNKSILSLKGRTIKDLSGKIDLTYKVALLSVCETHRPSKPGTGEALRAFDLGMKLLKAEEELELKEEEVKFLKDMIGRTNIFLSVVIGRLHYYFETNFSDQKVEDIKK